MPFWVLEEGFWPLAASITFEVKNNHAHVKTPGILNKFPEILQKNPIDSYSSIDLSFNNFLLNRFNIIY